MSILRLSKALAILAAIVAVSLTISGQQQVAPNAQTGMNGSFLGPKSVEMAAVPQYTGGSLNPPSTRSAVPEQIYKARKAAAALAPRRPGGAVGGPPAAANSGAFEPDPMDAAGDALDTEVGVMTVGVSTSLEGMNLSQCGSLAPGGALAVGGNYLVQALNNCIVVMNNGTGAIAAGFPKSLNAFFGAGGSGVYGPRALYDAIRNRFVVVAAQYTAATGFGNLWIAISKTSDPTGAWWIYALGVDTAQSGDFPDFPTLGLDKDIMYVGVTLLKSVGSALTDVVKFLPKTKMYAGQPIGTYFFGFNFNVDGMTLDSVQPANHAAFSKDYPRAGFLVASKNINYGGGQCSTGCNGLVVFAVSNALWVAGTPGVRITGAIVATANNYQFPPNALQPGCGSPTDLCAIDTGDTRISGQVTYTNGTLWGALNTKRSGNNTSTVLWFQLRPYLSDGDPACTGSYTNKCALISGVDILNEDCYFCGGRGNSGSDYFGVLVSNSEGDANMVAGYSDLSNYPGVFSASRRVTQTKNTMHDAGFYLRNGDAFYQLLDGVGRNRWGDYNAAQIDKDQFWFAGQYARSPSSSWGTRIGKSAFTQRNQP